MMSFDRPSSPLDRKLRRTRLLAPLAALAIIFAGAGLSGCSSSKVAGKRDPFAGKGSPVYPGNGPLPKGGGRYHVGKPYDIAGEKYYPREQPNYDETGTGSWYGPKFNRRMTSNGEWFDMEYLSAAHPTLPLPSYAKVTNVSTGKSIIVRVNDRGPFVNNRVIDLSKRSAEVLELKTRGTGQLRVQYIGPAPLNDKGAHLMAMNNELKRGTPLKYMVASANSRTGAAGGSAPVQVAQAFQTDAPRIAAAAPEKREPSAPPAPFQMAAASQAASSIKGSESASGGYYVQAAALSNPDNAYRVRAQLSGIGPVEVAPLEAGSRTLFRVRVGPLTDHGTADSALRGVIAAGYPDAKIVPAAY
ncbi:rare lipoprotein A [Rhodoligotrophos appendicifer]|uniref:septal ring lytic transglycosylase RlpA family protein n=1 Tax=Rhodoligotrophos appendicifer TaxID=987056 RepID=UPI00118627F1|nr:septal ring lytic transglycosylase RlpA family protein [Rhodoligotrophos appendicifer]